MIKRSHDQDRFLKIRILKKGKLARLKITELSEDGPFNKKITIFAEYTSCSSNASIVEKHILDNLKYSTLPDGWINISAIKLNLLVLDLLFCSRAGEELNDTITNTMPDSIAALLAEIKQKIEDRKNGASQKLKAMEVIAAYFKLGIPEHCLPDNIEHATKLAPDLLYATDKYATLACINNRGFSVPRADHVFNFYRLVSDLNNVCIAVCISKISMPYTHDIREVEAASVEFAENIGWTVTFKHEWSWHYPSKTGLFIYQQKTPSDTTLKLWQTSFKLWVMLNKKLLIAKCIKDSVYLDMCIEDITWDNTFPLNVNSYEELRDNYLIPYLHVGYENDEDKEEDDYEEFFLKNSFKFAFELWHINK